MAAGAAAGVWWITAGPAGAQTPGDPPDECATGSLLHDVLCPVTTLLIDGVVVPVVDEVEAVVEPVVEPLTPVLEPVGDTLRSTVTEPAAAPPAPPAVAPPPPTIDDPSPGRPGTAPSPPAPQPAPRAVPTQRRQPAAAAAATTPPPAPPAEDPQPVRGKKGLPPRPGPGQCATLPAVSGAAQARPLGVLPTAGRQPALGARLVRSRILPATRGDPDDPEVPPG